jgi:RNA polymerase sigma-70 factor (ECF subfamily)
MMLAPMFAQAAPPGTRAAFLAHPSLEAALRRLFEAGQASWPQIRILPEQFVVFLARQLPPEVAEPREFAVLRAKDLYITCALGLRDRSAQVIFQAEYMPRVRRALLGLKTPESVIADIQQNLYGRLLERQDAEVKRWGYCGRGELVSWLCTCAIREAGLRHKLAQRELALEQATQEILGTLDKTPESMTLNGNLKEAFQAAFQEAVASLTSRERNLLRYHFLVEMSIDQIGGIYQVHRATAARWISRAQERLIAKTRENFIARTKLSPDSLPQIMALIQSQLSMNLGQALKSTADSDPRS